MGIRGHVQTIQPVYNGAVISSWISRAAFRYLTHDAGLTIYTDGNGEDADHWEIEIPSIERMKEIASHLHNRPDALDKYLGSIEEDPFDTSVLTGKGEGENLAIFLDCGIKAAETNGYDSIMIDWF